MTNFVESLPDPNVTLGADQEWKLETSLDDWLYDEACEAAEDDLKAVYKRLGHGSTRSVFDGGSVVYKVGILEDQMTELRGFEDPATVDGLAVARCRMVHHASGAPILIMETVRPALRGDPIPDWAWRIDAHQVGLTIDGRWVIFDAGNGVDPICGRYGPGDTDWMLHPLPSLFAA